MSAEPDFKEGSAINGTQKRLYYSSNIWDEAVSKINHKIYELEKERDKEAQRVLSGVFSPKGYSKMITKVTNGDVYYQVYKDIYEKEPKEQPKPYIPPPQRVKTKLEKMLQILDSKTLFNSGILSKEEKKQLLDEYMESIK